MPQVIYGCPKCGGSCDHGGARIFNRWIGWIGCYECGYSIERPTTKLAILDWNAEELRTTPPTEPIP